MNKNFVFYKRIFFYFQDDGYGGKIIKNKHDLTYFYEIMGQFIDYDIMPEKCTAYAWFPKSSTLHLSLPWLNMLRTTEDIVTRFFGTGEWDFGRAIFVPGAFRFTEQAVNISESNLPLNFDIRCKISSFLTIEDCLNLSLASKNWLSQIRRNDNVRAMSKRNTWTSEFFKKGIMSREKVVSFINDTPGLYPICPEKIPKEYELWWYCSTYLYINLLWHKWEDYLADELDFLRCLKRRRCFEFDDFEEPSSDRF